MQNPPLPALLANLHFTVHDQGARVWYAVRAPDKRFLRLGRMEYLIASALDGQRSACDVVAAVGEVAEPTTQGTELVSEEDVLKVVSWLGKSGLIQRPDGAPPMTAAARKFSFNPIYTKIPLVAGKHLERVGGWFAPWLSWPVLVAVLILWLIAAIGVLSNWRLFSTTTAKLFVSDGWLWWGVAWLVLKTAHELGHAVMAVRVGSQIRSAGISLIFMAPVPYVDLSDLWTIPNRWQRILCCAGGILVEMTLAALAALMAVSTDNQALQYFCCAVATMGTVTTLAFNASPLIRFDGYFVFSDLLNYPNLYTEAQMAAKQFLFKCLLPWRPARQRMSVALVIYGLACYQYRIVMMVSLAIGTILAMQGVGVALVAWGAYATLIAPLLNLRKARLAQAAVLNSNPSNNTQLNNTQLNNSQLNNFQLNGNPPDNTATTDSAVDCTSASWLGRHREIVFSGGVLATICLLAVVVPSPIQPTIPGYVALRDPQLIRAEADGFLTEILVSGECRIEAGDLIARLSNPDLETELGLKRIELTIADETIALKRAQGHLAELQSATAQRDALSLQVAQLARRVENLNVRSPSAGQLVQNDLASRVGLFLKAGEPLAMVARAEELELVATVGQLDVASLRAVVGQPIEVRLSGSTALTGTLEKVEPRASDRLQEPLLAAIYGGPLAVQVQQSESGEEELKLLQPRFEMHLRLEPDMAAQVTPGQMVWLHTPGQPATLLDAVSRWCQVKWQALLQQSKQPS